jgi:hypothetical protein
VKHANLRTGSGSRSGRNRYVVTLISDVDPRRIRMNNLQTRVLLIADDGQVPSSLFYSLVRLFRLASFLS